MEEEVTESEMEQYRCEKCGCGCYHLKDSEMAKQKMCTIHVDR